MKPIRNMPFLLVLFSLIPGALLALNFAMFYIFVYDSARNKQAKALKRYATVLDASIDTSVRDLPGPHYHMDVGKVLSLKEYSWADDAFPRFAAELYTSKQMFLPLAVVVFLCLLGGYLMWERTAMNASVSIRRGAQGRVIWFLVLLLVGLALLFGNLALAGFILLCPTITATVFLFPWAWVRFYKYYTRGERTPREIILTALILPAVAQLLILVAAGVWFYISHVVERDKDLWAYRLLTDGGTYYVLHAPGPDMHFDLDLAPLVGAASPEVAAYLREHRSLLLGPWPEHDGSGDILAHNLPLEE